MCPVNRQSGIDELVLALTTPIKSIISRDQWKLSSILLRITNMSVGGLPATAARYIFEGTNEFKNLPAQQAVQVYLFTSINGLKVSCSGFFEDF